MANFDAGTGNPIAGKTVGVGPIDEFKRDAAAPSVDNIQSGSVGFWTPFPYEGLRWLKIANSGTSNPFVRRTVLDIGTEYRFIGYGLSDGYALPRLESDGVELWTGEALTVWQLIDVTFTATAEDLTFIASNSSSGQWVGFDFCSCETSLPLVDVACFTAEVVEPLPLGFNAKELGRILQETTLGGVKSYLICRPPNAFAFDTLGRGFDQAPYGGTF